MIRVTNLANAYDKAVNGDREERQYVAEAIVTALQKNGDVLDPTTIKTETESGTYSVKDIVSAFVSVNSGYDKITVVRFVRTLTNWSLLDAKRFVEQFPQYAPRY